MKMGELIYIYMCVCKSNNYYYDYCYYMLLFFFIIIIYIILFFFYCRSCTCSYICLRIDFRIQRLAYGSADV